MLWRWILDAVLLLVSLWFANLALFNWWAAGGPPNAQPETYAWRGSVFFALACLLFISFLILFIMNIRRSRA